MQAKNAGKRHRKKVQAKSIRNNLRQKAQAKSVAKNGRQKSVGEKRESKTKIVDENC